MKFTQFTLFSVPSFSISDPVALIESYCFQSNFYNNYDLIPERKVKDVNKIGARGKIPISKCEGIMTDIGNLKLDLLKYDLDRFLELSNEKRNTYIKKFNDLAVKKLLTEKMGFSKTTKILHTIYPKIIPIIDTMLQNEYKKIRKGQNKSRWMKGQPEIFIDYYDNLNVDDTKKNLDDIYRHVHKNLPGLTKVRIFDILWWSYLKSKRIKRVAQQKQGQKIEWATILEL